MYLTRNTSQAKDTQLSITQWKHENKNAISLCACVIECLSMYEWVSVDKNTTKSQANQNRKF